MKPLFIVLCFLFILIGDQPRAQEEASPVTRAYRAAIGIGEVLRTPASAGAGPADPFAAPDNASGDASAFDLQAFLTEELGIDFPEGTFARLDPATGKLELRHHPGVVAAIETYLNAFDQLAQKQLSIRAEIYEMPALAALKVQQICGPLDDHTPVLTNVESMVERGRATLVTVIGTISRSGQRSRSQAISEFIYPTEVDWNKAQDAVLPAAFETRYVGTLFEVDPVLGADDFTIDLNFSLEHHTAPPTMRPIKVTAPGGKAVNVVEMPEFHTNQIVTQLTLGDGAAKCVGGWHPSGGPGHEKRETMQVAFIRAEIQSMPPLTPWREESAQ